MFSGDASDSEHREKFFRSLDQKSLRAFLKPKFTGAYIVNFAYDFEKANAVIKAEEAYLLSFASLYIANPDLVGGSPKERSSIVSRTLIKPSFGHNICMGLVLRVIQTFPSTKQK